VKYLSYSKFEIYCKDVKLLSLAEKEVARKVAVVQKTLSTYKAVKPRAKRKGIFLSVSPLLAYYLTDADKEKADEVGG
jgi:hypothetical protein